MERPPARFRKGQVVAVRTLKREPVFRIHRVIWSIGGWWYALNGKQAIPERELRPLSEGEI